MTTPLRASSLRDDPGELIAALPALLSFPPVDSVVLVIFTGTGTLVLESVLRMDLQKPENQEDLIDQLIVAAVNHGASAVELVVLGGGNADPPELLPHRDLIEVLTDAIDDEGIVVAHSVWAPRIERGMTWWCYEDHECTGQVRDPETSPTTTAIVAAGVEVFASREEMEQLLAADPDEVLDRRTALLVALAGAGPEHSAENAARCDLEFVMDTIDGIATTRNDGGQCTVPAMNDETIVRLVHVLSNPDVREACLAFGLTVRARAAQALWMFLTRSTPGRARAEPASLLAACAYLQGEGALAGMAMDVAVKANPDHQLADTMRRVIGYGVPPKRFQAMLAQSFAEVMTRAARR